MLREVFARRFREETLQKEGLPDLVVVDGGIGQLNATQEIISELGLSGRFDLVSLAKSRVARAVASDRPSAGVTSGSSCRGGKTRWCCGRTRPPLLLLAAIRDEAHRFAIEYHRTLRSKGGIASGVEQIPGIGAKRRTALLRHFGSLQRLKKEACGGDRRRGGDEPGSGGSCLLVDARGFETKGRSSTRTVSI